MDNQHSVAPYPGEELEGYPPHPHGNLILAWSDVVLYGRPPPQLIDVCIICVMSRRQNFSYLCNIVLFNFPFVFIYLDFKYIISVFDNFRRTQFIVSVLTSTSFLFSFKSSWFFYPNRTSNMSMSCLCYLLKFVRFTSNYYVKEKWLLRNVRTSNFLFSPEGGAEELHFLQVFSGYTLFVLRSCLYWLSYILSLEFTISSTNPLTVINFLMPLLQGSMHIGGA